MSLPAFLIADLRLAFKTCARQHNRDSWRQLSTAPRWQRQPPHEPARRHQTASSSIVQKKSESLSTDHEASQRSSNLSAQESSSKDLVPHQKPKRSVGTGRKFDVPLKVVPKADVTPNVRLSPKERLHIEILTRRAPQKIENKIAYKDRLLIYHQGHGRQYAIICLKFSALFAACVTSAIVVPACYKAGYPIWLCATYLIGGFVPSIFLQRLLGPTVSQIFLHLPPPARQSAQTAMQYARNLPESATLDIEFVRGGVPTAGFVTAQIADLQTTSSKVRPVTFAWKGKRVDPGTWWRPNPVEFFVKPESSPGKAARYTIPGIWPGIYKRLSGVEPEKVSRWKR